MEIRLLRYFLAVAQEESISKAADILHITQPTLSRQLMDLEKELNTKLLIRGKRNKKITLTEDGKELYEIVNKSISGFDFAEKLAKDKNDISSGCIKIGCPSHFTSYLLMEKIEKVKKDYPDLNIKIICEVDINKMMSLLQNHEIDFAIIDTEIENSNIEIEELLKINNIFVSKAPLKIADIKESINELKEAMPEKSSILDELEEKFEQQELRIDRLEMKIEKILSALEQKDDMMLNRKVDKIEKLISRLGTNIEKLASYVDEE